MRFVCFRLYYWTIHQGNLAKAHWARTFPHFLCLGFLELSWHIGILYIGIIGVGKQRSKQWMSTSCAFKTGDIIDVRYQKYLAEASDIIRCSENLAHCEDQKGSKQKERSERLSLSHWFSLCDGSEVVPRRWCPSWWATTWVSRQLWMSKWCSDCVRKRRWTGYGLPISLFISVHVVSLGAKMNRVSASLGFFSAPVLLFLDPRWICWQIKQVRHKAP